jgi:hypothetical protein
MPKLRAFGAAERHISGSEGGFPNDRNPEAPERNVRLREAAVSN